MASRVISAILTLKDRDFSSNIKKASMGVDDFQRKLKHSRNLIDNFASSAVANLATVATVAGGIATAGVVGIGAAVASSVIEIDSAYSQLEAKTGLAGRQLEELQGTASHVFKEGFGESISQVANDVATLKSLFGELDGKELENLSKGAYTIEKLWGAAPKEVGTAVKNMTSNFKGLAEQDALDLLTLGFQKTGDYSDDLLDTMKEYSPLFAKLGLNAKDSMGILIKGAEAGAWIMDKVGDAVKEFGIRGMDGSKLSAEGYQLIGLNAEEMTKKVALGGESAKNAFAATLAGLAAMKDPVKQNTAGVALFGTQWEDVRQDVIPSMQGSAKAVEGFEGATKKARDAMHNNFGSKMTKTWREFKIGAAEAFKEAGGTEILETLASKADELVPKVQSLVKEGVAFAKTIQDNWGPISKVITPIAVAIGAAYVQLGAIAVWNAAKTAMDLFKASAFATTFAQHGLNAALRANPIGAVITAIALLVAGGVALYQNWDTVREKTAQFWEKLGVFKGVATIVLGPLGQIIRTAVTMAEQWDSTKSVWENVWNGIKLSAASAVNDVVGSINGMIEVINKIPGVEIPLVPKVNWGEAKLQPIKDGVEINNKIGSSRLNTINIPKHALGTSYFRGGIAQINERGGEIVDLPNGSRIYPHDESLKMARNEGTASTTKISDSEKTNRNVSVIVKGNNFIIREEMDIQKVVSELVREIEYGLINFGGE